jgi:hypothetical protein
VPCEGGCYRTVDLVLYPFEEERETYRPFGMSSTEYGFRKTDNSHDKDGTIQKRSLGVVQSLVICVFVQKGTVET